MLLYDIPGRTGTPIATETLVRLAEHPEIVGVKDAKDDVAATSEVLARTDLVYYCGTDMLNLPWLSLGAVGFVSVVGHVVGDLLHEMIDEFEAGQTGRARELHLSLLPVYTGHVPQPGAGHDQGRAGHARPARRTGPPAAGERDPGRDPRLREDLELGGLKLPGQRLIRDPAAPPGRTPRRLRCGRRAADPGRGEPGVLPLPPGATRRRAGKV